MTGLECFPVECDWDGNPDCKEWSLNVCDLKELPGTAILGQYFCPDLGWRPLMATPVALRSCLHVLLSQEGHRGGELWIVRVYCINRCSLQIGVSCSSSWLHIVKAGESERIPTLCLKHLDVCSACRLDLSSGSLIEPCLVVLGRIMKWIESFLSWCFLRKSCVMCVYVVSSFLHL